MMWNCSSSLALALWAIGPLWAYGQKGVASENNILSVELSTQSPVRQGHAQMAMR